MGYCPTNQKRGAAYFDLNQRTRRPGAQGRAGGIQQEGAPFCSMRRSAAAPEKGGQNKKAAAARVSCDLVLRRPDVFEKCCRCLATIIDQAAVIRAPIGGRLSSPNWFA